MSSAVMRIEVATLGSAPDGESRSDGQPNLEVTVRSIGTGQTHALRFWDIRGGYSIPAIATQADNKSWKFTPQGGADAWGQSFGLELVVDDNLASKVTSRRKYSIPTKRLGFVLPLFGEVADRTAAIYNAGVDVVAASVDNEAGDWSGWAKRIETALRRIDAANPLRFYGSPEQGDGDEYVHFATMRLPIGTLKGIEADIGCIDPADTVSLQVRKKSDASVIATLTRTGALAWATGAFSVAIASETLVELRLKCSDAAGTWICRGGEMLIR